MKSGVEMMDSLTDCGLRIADCGLRDDPAGRGEAQRSSSRAGGSPAARPQPPAVVWLVAIALLWFLSPGCFAVDLRVATFKIDVTPPPGSPLCDALVPAAKGVNDPLSARGIILVADDQKPVVLVAFDWVGIGNEGHDAWRKAIADACKTPVERVSVHALHQHDAPGCDFLAEKIAAEAGLSKQLFPVDYAHEAIKRGAAAAAEAMTHLEKVTQVGYGKGVVEKVASNRRILGPDGKVKTVRYSSSANDPAAREAPEGTIDPNVKLVSFWNSDKPLAVLSYYATHPQSYYYTALCSADFVGMGRDQAEAAEKTGLHIHFNGAGGNVTAGKYNDGSHEYRPILAGRLAEGMKRAWDATQKVDVGSLNFDWATRDVKLPLAEWYDEKEQSALLNNKNEKLVPRLRAARDIAWAKRATVGPAITIGRLGLGPVDILNMPGELFIEYQLAAQAMRPDAFVCMAAYGDYGPGYIGTAIAYTQGGYETGDSRVSRVSARVEPILMQAMKELLQ